MDLPKPYLTKAEVYIVNHCRSLEQARFAYLFRHSSPNTYEIELRKFQNNDGGFGNGLEPDFLMPDSSPLATSLAFQFIEEIENCDENIIKKAVQYSERTFDKKRNGWFAMSEQVNNYPHAIWWNWEKDKQQTSIDFYWGNPSAELIGYLSKYRRYLTLLNMDSLIEYAIQYWTNKTEFKSEHEVYCFIRLYKNLPLDKAKMLENNLVMATKLLVALDSSKWKEYNPQPLQFSDSPNFFLFESVREKINSNLDYLVNSINDNGTWSPNWSWHQYEDEWPQSRTKWEGIITIQNLKLLRAYSRFED